MVALGLAAAGTLTLFWLLFLVLSGMAWSPRGWRAWLILALDTAWLTVALLGYVAGVLILEPIWAGTLAPNWTLIGVGGVALIGAFTLFDRRRSRMALAQ